MSLSHLMWLNFFIADVQDGLGPYLGVFLKQKGFTEESIYVSQKGVTIEKIKVLTIQEIRPEARMAS